MNNNEEDLTERLTKSTTKLLFAGFILLNVTSTIGSGGCLDKYHIPEKAVGELENQKH